MCIISLRKVTGVVYTPGKMFNIEIPEVVLPGW